MLQAILFPLSDDGYAWDLLPLTTRHDTYLLELIVNTTGEKGRGVTKRFDFLGSGPDFGET